MQRFMRVFWALITALTAAILYVLPFYSSHYLWPIVFVFPLPIMIYAAHKSLTFLYGYLFGFVALALHLYGVFFVGVGTMGQGPWYHTLSPYIFIVFYQALFAGLFFWLWQKITLYVSQTKQPWVQVTVAYLSLYSFILYIDSACLFLFDRFEGYCLMNPLVPLAEFTPMLVILAYTGKWIMTLLIGLIPTLFLILWIYTRRAIFFAFLMFFLSCMGVLYVTYPKTVQLPAWTDSIVTLPMAFAPAYNLTFLVSSMSDILKNYLIDAPQTKVVVMPESSFYCQALAMPTLSGLWSETVIGRKIHVLAGAFRWEGDHFYNSVHWIYDGKLQNCFDKRHAMALTERLPSLFQFSFLKQSFFAKQPQVTPATKHKEIMHIDTEWSLVPYICSELFFNNYPDDNFGKAPIVAVCNDRLLAPYVAHLMFLAARCKATQWQRVIVYVSFLYQQVLMPSGHSAPLKRIS